jgi:molybdopterin synthase catalytic subunit
MADHELFALSDSTIHGAELTRALSDDAAGACVTFEGRVRNENEGREVESLSYEAYPAMALSEGNEVVRDAISRFELLNAYCVHRTGHLAIGDVAVWVGAISGHREEAFEACRFIIDEVKRRVPIWKKEYYTDAESAWVEPPTTN